MRISGHAAKSFAAAFFVAGPATAAEGLDGASLHWSLTLPFAGILLSIAFAPLLVRRWWHARYTLAAAFWAALGLGGLAAAVGVEAAAAAFVHTAALEYAPFIFMLLALFTAAGGLAVEGEPRATPLVNCGFLGLGALLASVIGTTGASMILIRPVLRANAGRPFVAHVFVFFIFLVSNIGGALTPLGDPPLFLGFLHGVDFFWTARHLWPQTLLACVALLMLFFCLDAFFFARERRRGVKIGGGDDDAERPKRLRLLGLVNLPLILCVAATVAASGFLPPVTAFEVMGTPIPWRNLMREGVMIAVAVLSILLTPKAARRANAFDWEPIREVAILFAAIFSCIIPVMAMLQAGESGLFAPVVALLDKPGGAPDPAAFFWATGVLSSMLDNAPTYLVFFELAGGDAATLMGAKAHVLAAISLGAVFMGALTYIGNAPNFMVYAIARHAGVKAPGFFPYMLWSCAILLPLFAALTLIFFWG